MTAHVVSDLGDLTSSPEEVARQVVVVGQWGDGEDTERKVVILDGEGMPEWWLDPEQAVQIAIRLIMTAARAIDQSRG